MMRSKQIIVASIFLVGFVLQGSAQSASIYGAYQDCPFHCRTIRIKPNFTFEYRLDGDLFNGETYRGVWKFLGKNRISAAIPADESKPQVSERAANRADDFLVTVIDASGAVLPSAQISGVANGGAFKTETSDEGAVRIPKCRQFQVAFNNYRGTHTVADPKADEFQVTLTHEQISGWAIAETWLVEGNKLYIAKPDGSFDKNFWLSRLSRKKERKLFP